MDKEHFRNSSAVTDSFALLVAKGILTMAESLRDSIELDMEYTTGIRIFDNLTSEQKVFMIHKMTFGLLDSTAKPKRLTAVYEGTIAALFAEIQTQIEMELDMDKDAPNDELCFYWRSTVRDVFLDKFDESFPMDRTLEEWSETVKELSDLLLDDSDYEEEWLTDQKSEKMHKIMRKSRMPKEYFNYIPNEPNSDECQRLLDKTMNYCKEIICKARQS